MKYFKPRGIEPRQMYQQPQNPQQPQPQTHQQQNPPTTPECIICSMPINKVLKNTYYLQCDNEKIYPIHCSCVGKASKHGTFDYILSELDNIKNNFFGSDYGEKTTYEEKKEFFQKLFNTKIISTDHQHFGIKYLKNYTTLTKAYKIAHLQQQQYMIEAMLLHLKNID